MFSKNRPGARFPGKRKQNSAHATQNTPDVLLLENPKPPSSSTENVVDEAKVKQYLQKLSLPQEENPSACIKFVISVSESRKFTPELQDEWQKLFDISSISISEENPFSVDQIVTLHGNLRQVSCAALFFSFFLCSKVNNIVKTEPFTLKSSNYHLDVLIEASPLQMEKLASKFPAQSMDYSAYDNNLNLHMATLHGDFTSLFNSIVFIFQRFRYDKYLSANVEQYPITRAHDGDKLFQREEVNKEVLARNKNDLLQYIYTQAYLQS
ncbi:hypothetical protein A9F13_01g08800 [Clavispora lusitaniae]|uniref:Uncharacterized protein n=1 Tax=Clavispora lusitaniae TaxID=36911 RepID=A0AA91T4D9_CLALS|nr:hypothetical protein A9F13_01g08800 [Clavispora lusitaniae]